MSIEETIRDAILDLHELLARADDVDGALETIAREHGLREDVLRARAAPNGLNALAIKLRHERAMWALENEIRAIVKPFVRKGLLNFADKASPKDQLNALIEQAFGRPITSAEHRMIDRVEAAEREIWQSENHAKILSHLRHAEKAFDAPNQ